MEQMIMEWGKYHLMSVQWYAQAALIKSRLRIVENEWEDKWSQRVQLSRNPQRLYRSGFLGISYADLSLRPWR